MKSHNQDLVYIYDSDQQKIIMIDGETGERICEKDDEVTSLLKYMDENNNAQLLRSFSVWCAKQINKELKPIQKKILDLAEKAITQNAGRADLQELYDETEGTAVAADTVGLRKGSKNAPAYLAARECINPDALSGAIQAARFHRLWNEMNEKDDDLPEKALQKVQPAAEEPAIERVRQQQVDHLLDLMNR